MAFRTAVLERDQHRCVNCGSTDRLEADHITSLANGGHPTDIDNGQTLCFKCNRAKGAK